MRIRSLTLWGFTSYKKKITIDFSDLSVFVITGPNGAGKSSLVESILFALYGRSPRAETGISSLISQDASQMGVDLEFYINTELFKVFRIYNRNTKGRVSASTVELRKLENGKWTLIASKSKEVTKKIENILGMDYHTFTRAVIIPQNMFDKFLKPERAKERRDILITLLSLSIYEKIREKAKEKKVALENELAGLLGIWDRVKDITQKDMDNLEEKLKEISFDIKRKERERETLEIKRDKIYIMYEKERELNKIERDLRMLLAKESQYKLLEEKIRKAEDVKELSERFSYINKLGNRYKEDKKELEESNNHLKKLMISLKKFEEKSSSLFEDIKADSMEQALSFYLEQKEKIVSILERLKGIRDVYDDFLTLGAQIKKEGEDLILRGRKYKKSYIKYLKLKKELDDAKKSEKEYYAHKIILTLKDGDICPVCGGTYKKTEVTKERFISKDIDKLKEQVHMYKLNIEKEKIFISNGILNLKEKRSRREQRKKELNAFKEFIYQEMHLDITGKILDDIEKLVLHRKDKINKTIIEIQDLKENIGKIKEGISILEKNIEIQRKKVEEVAKELELEKEKFREILFEKGYESFEDIRNFILSDKKLKELKEKQKNYSQSLFTLQKRQNELLEVLKGERGFEKRLKDLDEKLKILEAELKELTTSLASDKEKLLKMKKDLEDKKKIDKKMKKLKELLTIYNTIILDLESNRLPEYILATVLDILFEKASENLDILSQGRYTLELDENDNISVIDAWNGGEKRSIDTLSGGEVFATSLALAISLRELVQGKGILDTFFIDEGFGALDAQTREKVVEVLGALSETGKLVGIITHVEELAMNFPIGFKISKSPQGSQVEVISPGV